jgi:hypothetical protein
MTASHGGRMARGGRVSEEEAFEGMESIVSSRQHYKKWLELVDFLGRERFHILALMARSPVRHEPVKLRKASTFDNGDSKLKPKNPLLYKDLTDSIQVIS